MTQLAWFGDEKDAKNGKAPKGTLSLSDAAVLAAPGVAASGRYAFVIMPANGGNARTLEAAGEAEREHWVQVRLPLCR